MKKTFIVLLVVVGLLFTAGNAFGENVAATTGTAKVAILTPITLYHDTATFLNFGKLISPASETKVMLAPGVNGVATRSVPVGSQAILVGESTEYTLDFFSTVQSSPSSVISSSRVVYIGFDAAPISLTGGGSALTVTDFKAYMGAGYAANFSKATYSDVTDVALTANNQTDLDFYVGATLTVPASSTAGEYTGTYDVYLGY